MDGQGTKCRRNIAENFHRLTRVHERYRQTTDGRAIAYIANMSSRSLKKSVDVGLDLVKYAAFRGKTREFAMLGQIREFCESRDGGEKLGQIPLRCQFASRSQSSSRAGSLAG